MLLSMTGYGKSEAVYKNKKIVVEVRSLNGKTMDVNTRLAHAYFSKDLQLRQLIMGSVVRGKIDFCIKTEELEGDSTATINPQAVASYVSQIRQASEENGIDEPKDWWPIVLRMPGVIQASVIQEVSEEEWNIVVGATEEALKNFTDFRRQEGEAVAAKFYEKLDNIQKYLADIERYETARTEKIRSQIVEKLESLPVEYDKNRLEQELIYYIEKLDINEEKQRLCNHLKYFAETIRGGEAQGRKLGFIAQEMGREINTMGSKSNQAEMQNLVVKMKDELEQIKEQVLNVL